MDATGIDAVSCRVTRETNAVESATAHDATPTAKIKLVHLLARISQTASVVRVAAGEPEQTKRMPRLIARLEAQIGKASALIAHQHQRQRISDGLANVLLQNAQEALSLCMLLKP